VAAIHRWAEANGVPIRSFAKGENKEKIAEPLLRAAAEERGEGRVVLIGIAQEKASAWPDQVVLIFDRKLMPRTPGRFATRVVTRGVNPQLYCTCKSSRLKQYFKLGKALRTETVIGDTRDFGVGRRVSALNWTALRAVGESANRRLCDAELQTARPAPDVVTLTHVTRPSTTTDGLHCPALAFGDSRVMALLAALVLSTHALPGFDNRQLVRLIRRFWNEAYSSRQATYDLRRLRRKAMITRLPHSHRYQLTPFGRRVAVLFTKAHGRVLAPGLALLEPTLPPDVARRSPVAAAWRETGPRTQPVRRSPTPCSLKLDQPVNLSLGKPSLVVAAQLPGWNPELGVQRA
jgi:hypothetical protein